MHGQQNVKIPVFGESRMPNVVTLTARHKLLAWASWIQQTPLQTS